MKADHINYNRVAQAQLFYKALGYANVEAPWLVSPQAVIATLPQGKKVFQSNFGCSVGSAEQSFIQMMLDGEMEPGRYQATGPCYRDEDKYDDLTRMTFLKTELIWYNPQVEGVEPLEAYEQVFNHALQCFFHISDCDKFSVVKTEEGVDIYCNGVELGSYGIRKIGDQHIWVYGTGLAEPRFTLVAQKGYGYIEDEATGTLASGRNEPLVQGTQETAEALVAALTEPECKS